MWGEADYDLFHYLAVAMTVPKVQHGASPSYRPKLLAVVRVNDDYTWVTEHRLGSADGTDDHTATFGPTYYSDVPDDVAVARVRITAWSQNDLRGDDVLVDASFGQLVNAPYFGTTWTNGNAWLSYAVWTVGLNKANTLLVTGTDVTVTSSTGQTRMAAPDRFFVFTLDLTSAWWPLVPGVNTILVPRSVFLDTKLKADFDAGNYGYLPNAAVYGDDLSKASMSDGVAAVIAGTLRGDQAIYVLDHLLMNASGGWPHTYVDVTGQVLVANLPTDVVRIVPWEAVVNGLTGDLPADLLQKIGAVATTVVNALVYVGQLIYKGLVALGTFLVNLAQAIADWGMKALGTVVNAAVQVAQAVGEALSKLWEWAVSMIQSMLAPLVDAIKGPMRDEGITLTASTVPSDVVKDPVERRGFLESVWDMIGSGNFFNLVVAFVLGAQVVAAIAANVIFPGAGSIVVKAIETIITSLLIGLVVSALVDTVLMGLDAVFKAAVPGTDSF